MSDFVKREIALRYFLQGRNYFRALEAMEFAKGFHKGVRKDGVTPEFDHQVSIALYVSTLEPWLEYPEDTYITILLHDVREDYNVSNDEIENRYGKRVSTAVHHLTKVFRGVKKDPEWYFGFIADDPIASIAKGGDRVHNFGSMVGVFNIPKQKEYIIEGETHFLPMLKTARRKFVRQVGAYENIKMMLNSQIFLIKEIHKALEKNG